MLLNEKLLSSTLIIGITSSARNYKRSKQMP
jgi:hypothetical protein